jgi:hypothetical protein
MQLEAHGIEKPVIQKAHTNDLQKTPHYDNAQLPHWSYKIISDESYYSVCMIDIIGIDYQIEK